MKAFKRNMLAAGLAAAMLTSWQAANAATGSTSVTIDFPDIIILHYISGLTLTFTGDVDTQQDNGTGAGVAALASTATFDAGLSPNGGPTIPSSVAVTVQNVWAVRGITATGQIRVDPNIVTAAATNTTNGTSTTTMSNLQVQTSTVTAGDPIDVNAPGFAVSNAVLGDIVFDLDTSGVTNSGAHTGMQYTITATATP